MSAIGILGGMGPQASVKLYELLIRGAQQHLPTAADEDYPEIVLLNVPIPNFISNKDEMPRATEMLINRTKLLEKAGATINGIACNTVHILLDDLQDVTRVPFVSIPKLVAELCAKSYYGRVGLLATPTTLHSELYDEALYGIADVIRPDRLLVSKTEVYIYKQLRGNLSLEERRDFISLVRNFRQENKLDAVILGCTELPLVYGESRDDDLVIDTLQVLCDGLLRAYFEQ